MRLKNLLTLYTIALTLSGCGGGGGSTSTDPINITITDNYQVESLGSADIINATVSVGNTAKSLYLVLSNNDTVSATSTITHNAKVTPIAQAKTVLSTDVTEKPRILRHPHYVEEFNAQIGTLLSNADVDQFQAKTIAVLEKLEDVAGTDPSTATFYRSFDTSDPTEATARYVSPMPISTAFGDKTLNIWVSNDSFDKEDGSKDCIKSKCVTQDMVNALADTFLKADLDNDIYDWITNIYGEEWGSDAQAKYSNLIGANDEITILLTDIENDNSDNGGVVGFFYPKDNYDNNTEVSGSNERVMFYIDSVMFANGDDTLWSIDDQWPKEMISTLAHEFQHMIHFYQKTVLLTDENTETWLNEMLSESTEDLVATKIRHIGPRGVDYLDGSAGDPGNTLGRYPLFNANNTLSLTIGSGPIDQYGNPTFALEDYSKVNAFGAYLLRNYGGARLFHDIMHNAYLDEQAVVDAVSKSPEGSGKTFANLLSEWGVAVMLSDHDNLVDTPEYNTGWFTDSVYGSTTYELGSINFFNYILLDPLQDGPKIYTTSGTVQAQGNYYYKIGDNLTGDISIKLELNGQTEATLIAK